MLYQFSSLLLGAAYFTVLWLRIEPLQQRLLWLLGFVVLTSFINLFFHRKELTRRSDLTFLLLPVFWIFGITMIVILQPTGFFRFFASVATLLGFLMIELRLRVRRDNPRFTDTMLLLSAVGLFVGVWAFDFYLTPDWWVFLIVVFVVAESLTWYGFYQSPLNLREKLIFSIIIALLLTQASWALLLWPLHYITTAAVLIGFFYLAYELVSAHMRGELNLQKVLFHTIFIILVEVVLLSTAQWLPVI